MKNQLTCSQLIKKYGRREVVKGATLTVNSNEIVGLLGPNGAGKTTIFRMMLGIVIPTKGTIHLNQEDITHIPIHLRAKRGITYLPQEVSVFTGLTVRKNVSIIFENMKMPKRQIREKTQQLIEDFGISHLENQKATNLSGGEKRRLELARMMTLEPKFILLDEPFSGIDPMTVKDIQRMSIQLKEMGIGVIVTDHNVDDIRRIVDRLYVIHKGTILAEGDPESVFSDRKVIENYLGE
ncbi:MAG: LPS export ABC transporter ATP-binding protein [Thermotogota bacterium]